jgi:uncharacterized protein YprB with RNaseH-like and TPR domain
MDSLSETLKSLGVSIGTSDLKSPAVINHKSPQIPGGEERSNNSGSYIYIEEHKGKSYTHGKIDFSQTIDSGLILRWANIPNNDPIDIRQFVFIDTETSGLSGGTGTFAFLIGLGYFDGNEFIVKQYFLRDPSEERAALEAVSCDITPFRYIVTYNGKSFDIPILNSRHIIHGMTSPFKSVFHIDLLHLARKIWKERLPSRALGELEKEILSFQREGLDIPGWMVPDVYFDYLARGITDQIEGVLYHNRVDIISLAGIYWFLADLIFHPTNSTTNSIDKASIGALLEKLGDVDKSAEIYEMCLSEGLPRPLYLKTIHRFADIKKKNGDITGSILMFEKAADLEDFEACIEISKLFEHNLKDNIKALEWAKKAQALIPQPTKGTWKEKADNVSRRILRLSKKV